ncbi:MAG: hypothetical protein IJU35_06965 [Paludibacteraceae bacterium]|nr:hypothetical protein [Paludibacteraceae bacterium]
MAVAIDSEFLRNLSAVAEDENLMARLSRYMHRLLAEKKDETLFTKEEYFRRLDEAENNYALGHFYEMRPDETLEEFINRTA